MLNFVFFLIDREKILFSSVDKCDWTLTFIRKSESPKQSFPMDGQMDLLLSENISDNLCRMMAGPSVAISAYAESHYWKMAQYYMEAFGLPTLLFQQRQVHTNNHVCAHQNPLWKCWICETGLKCSMLMCFKSSATFAASLSMLYENKGNSERFAVVLNEMNGYKEKCIDLINAIVDKAQNSNRRMCLWWGKTKLNLWCSDALMLCCSDELLIKFLTKHSTKHCCLL